MTTHGGQLVPRLPLGAMRMALEGGEVNAGNVVDYLPVGLYSTSKGGEPNVCVLQWPVRRGEGFKRNPMARRIM